MPAVTLRTIAKALGVSPMTVSLALRNSRELPAATRIRIRRTAETMGYRPDPRVRAWLESRREPGVQHGEVLAYLNSYPTERLGRLPFGHSFPRWRESARGGTGISLGNILVSQIGDRPTPPGFDPHDPRRARADHRFISPKRMAICDWNGRVTPQLPKG